MCDFVVRIKSLIVFIMRYRIKKAFYLGKMIFFPMFFCFVGVLLRIGMMRQIGKDDRCLKVAADFRNFQRQSFEYLP
jgi:hypothetical protein